MLATKQKKWPIFQLLTVEKDENEEIFINKINSLKKLYKDINLIGFVFNSEIILKYPLIIKDLLNNNFKLATYGKPNNTKEGIIKQFNNGIFNICTDIIPLLKNTIKEFNN